ncbi:DUF1292 domain-containing protein [Psychrobacillus sp.]|uniref:DUF1292 domain-containing protein n=1 Tax=Psychrobacillus sp. TaxID=1871623 RepID=UPI0028BD52BC|nr:DUF1292 domain-containing protein [Psychrobacillus sp.]
MEEKIEIGQTFMVLDENDQEQEMEVIGLLTVEEVDYTAVGFVEDIQDDETDEEIDVFFFRIGDGGELSMIDNDEEFDKVSSAFREAEEAAEAE